MWSVLMEMNAVDKVSYLLAVVGGLNWGLVGAFQYNLVDSLLGTGSTLSRIVYVLVGLAALNLFYKMSMMSGRDKA